jgi:hypothetical protein
VGKLDNYGWWIALKTMWAGGYWNKPNTVEFFAFMIKIIIIIPGLIWGISIWWLYLISLGTSIALVWSSTVKTLPTIIILNIAWIFISLYVIIREVFTWI